jgi:CBS domain-containing protein
MNKMPVTIDPNSTFGAALEILLEKRIRSLPVVDSGGTYRGMFDIYDVWKQMLPRAILTQEKFLEDLSFFSGSHRELNEKLAAATSKPLTEFLDDTKSPPIHSETPVEEAILLLFRHDCALPVIEKKTRRFLGIVTVWEILNSLRETRSY